MADPPRRRLVERGTFRGAEDRAWAKEMFVTRQVPNLARREVAPLLRFLPTRQAVTAFDIGAHKGLWTRALWDVFGERIKHVYLFDPSPENYRELTNMSDNLAGITETQFRCQTVIECALGSEAGTATLHTNEDGSPLGSLYPHNEPGWGDGMKHIQLSQRTAVTVDTVDGFIDRHGIPTVDIMKIDTEGYEMNVLRGAERSIRAGRVETITFEFGVHHVEARVFFKDFWSHLTQRGYALYYLEEGEITPITRYEYRWERFNRNYDFVASRRSIQ